MRKPKRSVDIRDGNGLMRVFVLAIVVAMVGSIIVPGVLAQGNDAYNHSEVGEIKVVEQYVDISEWNNSEMDDTLMYYDDNGDTRTLNASLNDTLSDDPRFGYEYTEVEDDQFLEWPRADDGGTDGHDKSDASWADASEWNINAAGNSKAFTASDTDARTASNVESIELGADSSADWANGDHGNASYSNFSVTSSPTKRYVSIFYDVEDSEAGSILNLNFTESDGDYVSVHLVAPGRKNASTDVGANQSGDGFVYQEQISDLTVEGSGDGTLNSIDYINATAFDGDARATLTRLELGKSSAIDLGNDGDESKVTNVTTTGEFNTTGMDTLGGWADDAAFKNFRIYKVDYTAADQDPSEVSFELSDAPNYGGYEKKAEIYVDITPPSQIDLTHNTLELFGEQKFVNNRYATTEYVEGTGDEDFSDASGFTDLDSTYNSKGDTHSIDSSMSVGTEYRVHYILLFPTEEEAQSVVATGGVAGPPDGGGGGGGILGFFSTLAGKLMAVAGSILGLKWLTGN